MSKGRAMRVLAMSGMGEEQRRDEQSEVRSNWGEPKMIGWQNERYGIQNRDDYERQYPPHGNRRSGREGRWEDETEGGYEGRRGPRMDMDEPMGRRQDGRRYARARQRGGGMYSGQDDPMGFDMSAGEGGSEDEWSGRFRGVQVDHEPEEDREPDEERLKKWVKGMKNADGTTGEHFKQDHTDLMRASHCPSCDKTEFYAAVNMMYSDYCEVAKRMGVDQPDFYGCMAKAFLMDKDAGKGKIGKYMRHVAGK